MIVYVDTSVVVKLLIDDETGTGAAEQLWLSADHLVCAEIGYAEARAALASAHRARRLTKAGHGLAKAELERLWEQVDVVAVTTSLVRAAGDLAEIYGLRGYDAVHLAAAVTTGVTVVATADSAMAAAASRHGFATADLAR